MATKEPEPVRAPSPDGLIRRALPNTHWEKRELNKLSWRTEK